MSADESYISKSGRAEFVGFIQDHDVSWNPGFAVSVDHATNLFVELIAILNGASS